MTAASLSAVRNRPGNTTPPHADLLPDTLELRAFVPFLVASIVIAAAYGTSFLLPDYLKAHGMNSAAAGAVISSGMIATIVCCCFAGWVAQRIGVMPTIAGASLAMALAMLGFAGVAIDARAAYVGGMLVGVGWSVFFILAPLQIIHHLRPAARIQYLTIVSGAQMAGLGLATPLSRLLAQYTGSVAAVYVMFAAACVVAAICVEAARRAMAPAPCLPMTRVAITARETLALLSERTVAPIAMIVFAACIFTGLSTYQSVYAESRHLRPDLFFLAFTATSVALRFSLARVMGRMPVQRLALLLFVATAASLTLFIANTGSTLLYVAATVVFATGYGLSYSTLNGMAVNLAGEQGVSVPVTSQIFTLAYFIGLFGFPFIGGQLIRSSGPNAMLLALLAAVAINVVLLAALRVRVAAPAVH